MRYLKNPVVVVVLVLLALAAVLWNAFPKLRSAWKRTTVQVVAAPVAAVPGATNVLDALPGSTLNQTNLAARFDRWVDSSERDPFEVYPKPAPRVALPTVALDTLKLQAIWRQTGRRLAVINQKIFEEGQSLEGLEIQKIESDRVWMMGPHGRVRLDFASASLVDPGIASTGENPPQPQ